MADPEETKEI